MWKWKAAVFSVLILIFINHIPFGTGYDYDYDDQKDSWSRCPWIRNKLKNGRVRVRSRGRIAKFSCKSGFELIGKRFATCVRGQWNNAIPVCVAKGCRKLYAPSNGKATEMYRGAQMIFDCNPGYRLAGDSILYCDGSQWDKDLPVCQATTTDPQTSCDFEDPDICGWNHDPTHDFDWRRNQFGTPSGHVGTGPSYDHTYGKGKAGFYMYGEASAPRVENDTSRLYSPVFPKQFTQACFLFWYHMYGAATGGLRIYIKPESHVFAELMPLWEKYGDQGNQWFRGNISVPTLNQDFQIVIESVRGPSYVGDIAIDDVTLLKNTDCGSVDLSNATESVEEVSNTSCRGRCHERGDNSTSCGCSESCESDDSCCSDYVNLCAERSVTGEDESRNPITQDIVLTTESISELTTAEEIGTALYTRMPTLIPEVPPIVTNNVTESSVNQSSSTTLLQQITTPPQSKSTSTQSPTLGTTTTIGVVGTLETGTLAMASTASAETTSREITPDVMMVTSNAPTASPEVTAWSTVSTEFPVTTASTTTNAEILPQTIPFITKATELKHFSPTNTNPPPTVRLPSTQATSTTSEPQQTTTNPPPLPPSTTRNQPQSTTSNPPPSTTPNPPPVRTIPNRPTQEKVTTMKMSSSFAPSTTNNAETSSTVSTTKVFVTPLIYRPVTIGTIPQRSRKPAAFGSTTTTSSTSKSSTASSTMNTRSGTTVTDAVLQQLPTTRIPYPRNTPRTTSIWKVRVVPTTTSTTRVSTTVRTTIGIFYPAIKKTTVSQLTTNFMAPARTTESQPVNYSSKSNHAPMSAPDVPKDSGPSVIGICIGILVLAGVAGGVAYVFLRRRRQMQKKLADDSEIKFLSDNEVIEFSEASGSDRLL